MRAGPPLSEARGRRLPPSGNGHTHRSLTLLAACLGFAVVQLDVSVVNVAIKPIGEEMGGGVDGLQWVVSAYTISFAALILTAGALGDRVGARRVFIAGFAIFTVASALCGLAPSLPTLVGARAIQGIGAAALVPCSLALLNHTFVDPEDRARAVGLWAAGASAALAGGPLVGGVLIASLGWRAIFFINAPLGAAGIGVTMRWAPETSRSGGTVDLGGQLAAIVALAVLAGATIEGGSRGFGDPAVLAGFVVAITSAATFLVIESRRIQPMLPLGLFRSMTFSAATAIGFLVNVVFYGLIFLFSLYFQRAQGYSAIQTGLAFVPTTAAVMAANLLARRTAERCGVRTILTFGGALILAAAVTLLRLGAASPYSSIVLPLVALGVGLGLIVPVMTSALLGTVEAERSGVASGTLNTARQVGSVIGVALFGALVGGDLVSGLHAALIVSGALALVVCVLALHLD